MVSLQMKMEILKFLQLKAIGIRMTLIILVIFIIELIG
jgi:hypothetical protein